MRERCAVTGAAGYLGGRVAATLGEAGWDTRRLVRKPSFSGDVEFDLRGDVSPAAFEGCSALIHCAHDFAAGVAQQRAVNIDGGIRVFDAARRAGVARFVVVSSVSAYEGCRSEYGRAKLELEQYVASVGGASLRPGMIWGRRPHGVLGALTRVTARLPLLPVFDSGRQEFVLGHVDDVALSLVACLQPDHVRGNGPLVAAHVRRWTFVELLAALAASHGRRLHTVSVPGGFALGALRAAERVGLRLPLTSDNLLGLLYPVPSFGPFYDGVAFREFDPASAAGG